MSEGDINYDFTKLMRKNIDHLSQDKYILDTHEEFQYLNMIKSVISNGREKEDRTGVGTISTFGNTMRFDLGQSFPLLTTKKVFFRGVVEELLWFIRGETNGNKLLDKKIKIWEGNGSREYLDSIGLHHRETKYFLSQLIFLVIQDLFMVFNGDILAHNTKICIIITKVYHAIKK